MNLREVISILLNKQNNMTTMILGRPLTFGDEEQIKEIRKEDLKHKLKKDIDYKGKLSEYRELENQIDELETERDNVWSELEAIGKKYGIAKKEFYYFT